LAEFELVVHFSFSVFVATKDHNRFLDSPSHSLGTPSK